MKVIITSNDVDIILALQIIIKKLNFRNSTIKEIRQYRSVVAATTTLQNFALASFWSLPTNHP